MECGVVADGCGGSLDCGECSDGQVCGTGSQQGQCLPVDAVCTSATSCVAEAVECGVIADGCGGTIDCGQCGPGQTCGTGGDSGSCIDVDCDPRSCAELGAECGAMPDGCGGILDCGDCGADQYCGTGADHGTCLEVDCSPKSCADFDSGGDCGPHADGCGGVVDCGFCPDGQECGSGTNRGECIVASCTAKSCSDYDDVNCGPVSDGCDGVTVSCGDCQGLEVCGGGGIPNVCGADNQADCDGEFCNDQVICSGGGATTVTGTVFAPNATLPLPNAVVYVPNVPLDELPSIDTGPVCQQCEDEDLGDPLVGTISDYDGTFELRHVPAGVAFPLVIKIGDWRRVVTVGPLSDCSNTQLTAEQTRLPRTHQEGSVHDNLPHVAVSTGGIDAMECVFHKMGVDESEFTRRDQDGRIHMYRANGGVPDAELAQACQNSTIGCSSNYYPDESDNWQWECGHCGRNACTDRDPDSCGTGWQATLLKDHLSHHLYDDQATLNSYDMVVFDCEILNHSDYRTDAQRNRILDYVNSGGRLFASHHAYDWLHDTDELQDTAVWGGTGSVGSATSLAYVDATHLPGSVYWDWLQLVDADHPTTGSAGQPQIEITDARTWVQSVDSSLATRWIYTEAGADGHIDYDSVQQFSFDTPVYDPSSSQCGQVAYSAFHVADVLVQHGPEFPTYCEGNELTDQEKTLAYLLFDLAACVSDSGIPEPAECDPRGCADVGATCGTISDGCGDTVECGSCPPGEVCGGGGTPNVCSGGCQPLTCAEHDAECGIVDDGCGSTLDCGDCPQGTSCGATGTPNQCDCDALSCTDHGAECGVVSDGCGDTVDCGDCPPGETCGGGGEPNICGAGSCDPVTCSDHGAECGAVDDGCGGILDCGECPSPYTCGGGGTPNVCDCPALGCVDHQADCGAVSDGCGNSIDCGECPEGQECVENECVTFQCRPAGDPCEYAFQCCSEICAIDSPDEEGVCIEN